MPNEDRLGEFVDAYVMRDYPYALSLYHELLGNTKLNWSHALLATIAALRVGTHPMKERLLQQSQEAFDRDQSKTRSLGSLWARKKHKSWAVLMLGVTLGHLDEGDLSEAADSPVKKSQLYFYLANRSISERFGVGSDNANSQYLEGVNQLLGQTGGMRMSISRPTEKELAHFHTAIEQYASCLEWQMSGYDACELPPMTTIPQVKQTISDVKDLYYKALSLIEHREIAGAKKMLQEAYDVGKPVIGVTDPLIAIITMKLGVATALLGNKTDGLSLIDEGRRSMEVMPNWKEDRAYQDTMKMVQFFEEH